VHVVAGPNRTLGFAIGVPFSDSRYFGFTKA